MSTGDNDSVWQTDLPGLSAPRRGKVRDIYDLGDRILLVATDRLSAYDHILRPAIPGKGRILTQLDQFLDGSPRRHRPESPPRDRGRRFPGRASPLCATARGPGSLGEEGGGGPFECVARGFLAGSAYKEYKAAGTACGIALPPGLDRASRLAEPIFTPATKADSGHDENIDYATLAAGVGAATASRLRELTLALYTGGGRARRVGRPAARRHQVRVRHRRRRGRAHRRSPDPGLLALLGGGGLETGHRTGVVRQAVRPQLAGRLGLGPRVDSARAPGGGRRRDPRALCRGLPPADRPRSRTLRRHSGGSVTRS